jgi:hypothetical protein
MLTFKHQENNTEFGSINLAEFIKPMLHSVEVATVLETCHCILLMAIDRRSNSEISVSHHIDDAVTVCPFLFLTSRPICNYWTEMKRVCPTVP